MTSTMKRGSIADLSPEHYHQLHEESGISDETIEARGYRTIRDAAELEGFGFAPAQRRVPGLLLPLCTTDGQNELSVYKPDNPRVAEQKRKGKQADGTYPQRVIKYEQPKGEPTRVDCPPMCQADLVNPAVDLFITEGQKKADSLASRGACTVALLGVWNWKSRNDYGGTTFTNDLDYIAWEKRNVYLVFDNDWMTKTGVRQALDRFREHLQRKGATVHLIYLPHGDDGKLGVDDWFVRYPDKTLDDLKALAEGPRPELKPAAAEVELLDAPPAMMRRPLALINDRAYAATWLYVRVTKRESLDKKGNIVRHDPPIVEHERRLFVVRDDGKIFGDGGHGTLEELDLELLLPEIPQASQLLSAGAVKSYAAGYRPDAADVFGRVAENISRFIDFKKSLASQEVMAEMVACWVMSTWFLDAFNVASNIWPNGERGSGKTQLLYIVGSQAYLGQVILAGGSYASLRDLADYGATMLFDDAENIADPRKTDPDKRALLLAGNRRGNTVTVKELAGDKTWRTRHVHTYAFRGFSAIKMPDGVLGSRTIVVPLIRTPDRYRANADPLDYSLWPHDRAELVDDLWMLALAHLPEMPAYESAVNEEARLTGRNLEPWKALLAVARWLDEGGAQGLWNRMEQLSSDYQKERPNLEFGDLTALVVRALANVTGVTGVADVTGVKKVTSVATKSVTEQVQVLINEEELDLDADKIDSRRIGRVLGKMRFKKDPDHSKDRGWLIPTDDLVGMMVAYGIDAPPFTNASDATNASNASEEAYECTNASRDEISPTPSLPPDDDDDLDLPWNRSNGEPRQAEPADSSGWVYQRRGKI